MSSEQVLEWTVYQHDEPGGCAVTADLRGRRSVLLAWGLIVFSPYVGEFMLGNQLITALPSLLLLAPMYGCGALVIREVTRRLHAGWPTMVLLAAAYALIEEGLVDQMLFNPGYLGLADFSGLGWVPGLGLSARLTLDSVVVHTVWSICIPIAVVEAFAEDETRPWLSHRGLILTGAVFVVACVALGVMQAAGEFHFVATPAQFGVTAGAILVLIVGAFAVRGRRPGAGDGPPAPGPYVAAAAAFGLSSGYWVLEFVLDSIADEWITLGCLAAYAVGGTVVIARVARRPGWGRRHVFAVAAGALLTYGWLGAVNSAALPGPRWVGLLGNVVFTAGGIVVLLLAARARRRRDTEVAAEH